MSLRIDEIVGLNLKTVRVQRNLTQQALADRAKVSKQTISNLESGQGATSKTIERLAECLEVSPLTFYKETVQEGHIRYKRVSGKSSSTFDATCYVQELSTTIDNMVQQLKSDIFYKQVSPIIKEYFEGNADSFLRDLDVARNDKNCDVIFSMQDGLLESVRCSILGKDDELDELLED